VAKLVAAVKASEFLAVDDKEENFRRTTALPDSDVTILRSIMADKLPLDSTIEDLLSFFNTFAPVLSVRLIKEFVQGRQTYLEVQRGARQDDEGGICTSRTFRRRKQRSASCPISAACASG
jgi:hypothetical protein